MSPTAKKIIAEKDRTNPSLGNIIKRTQDIIWKNIDGNSAMGALPPTYDPRLLVEMVKLAGLQRLGIDVSSDIEQVQLRYTGLGISPQDLLKSSNKAYDELCGPQRSNSK